MNLNFDRIRQHMNHMKSYPKILGKTLHRGCSSKRLHNNFFGSRPLRDANTPHKSYSLEPQNHITFKLSTIFATHPPTSLSNLPTLLIKKTSQKLFGSRPIHDENIPQTSSFIGATEPYHI